LGGGSRVAGVRLEVLGPLRVTDGGRSVTLGGPKQQHVLACLIAAYPGAVAVDVLVEDLWGGRPPATAAHVVSTYVSGLRSALRERIWSEGATHRLVLGPDDTIDAVELVDGLRRARELLSAHPAGALAALPVLEAATIRPYGSLADGSEILGAEVRRLEELLLASVETRIEAELGLGRSGEVVAELLALSDRWPFRERVQSLLMLALYREGRQAEALATYRRLRVSLAEELGVDPSQALQELEMQILLQDDRLLLEPPHVLPQPLTELVGRRGNVQTAARLVQDHRLVTLTGPGGVGKTRLALAAARSLLREFRGGTWWVDLSPVVAVERVGGQLAAALGLPDQPTGAELGAVRTFLARRRALVVLDNCEHLLPALADLVAELLAGAAELRVLATSRRSLGIPGEERVLVAALAPEDAQLLFATRAAQARPSSVGSVDDASIAQICRRLDRLPLAIELAAARCAVLAPAQVAQALEVDPLLTGVELAGVPDKHRTMVAAIGWSYELLPPSEQAALEALSTFRGGFDLEAACAVMGLDQGPGARTVAALADASMLSVEPGPDSSTIYRMLATIRRFAQDRLVAREAVEPVRERHARYFLALFDRAGWARLTPEFAEWMPRLERARPEIVPALDWSLGNLPASVTATAAPGLFEFWFRRGDPVPAYTFGVRILAGSPELPARLEAAARLCAGFGGAFAGDVERATVGLDQAIALLADDEDWPSLVWALLGRGQNATVYGDTATAATMGRRILEVCDQHAALGPRAYGLALLGEAEFLSGGDLVQARHWAEEAIEGLRVLRDPASLNLFGLGIAAATCAQLGDLDAAERYAVEATTLPGRGWRATALVVLGGWVLHPKGEIERAVQAVRGGVVLAQEMSMEPWARHGILMLARLAAQRQEWEQAARLFGAAHPQPPWGSALFWWAPEQAVMDALGAERFDALSAAGAATPLEQLVGSLAVGTPSFSA
jgi:predicted ATPase/DNA-binding SARP family transcriptional activator